MAKRELYEETGLVANKLELFGIFSGTLRCQENEVDELKFFDRNEIPENISQPVRKALFKWMESKPSPIRIILSLPLSYQAQIKRTRPTLRDI